MYYLKIGDNYVFYNSIRKTFFLRMLDQYANNPLLMAIPLIAILNDLCS